MEHTELPNFQSFHYVAVTYLYVIIVEQNLESLAVDWKEGVGFERITITKVWKKVRIMFHAKDDIDWLLHR